jgi:acyl-CoA thioester hydrolase
VTEPATARVPIRWRDCDGFQHVNNAVYLNYLEEGRDRWLELVVAGTGATLHEFVLRHVSVDYASALVQDDREAIVTIELESVGTSSITLRETIVAGSDGRVAVNARAVLVHTTPDHAASKPLPDDLRTRLAG